VDTSGKRRRWIRRGSIAVVTVLTAYGVVVALSFVGGPVPPNALLPLPGVPGAATPPGGASPAVGVGGATATASDRDGATPSPGPGAGSSGAAAPKQSASPSATASPTSTRRVPPGLAGKSASPGTGNGHGH
jgi:hypothetical protein